MHIMARKKTDPPMRRANYYLTARQFDRLNALSLQTGRDRSTIIRLAVDAYLDRMERRAKESDR